MSIGNKEKGRRVPARAGARIRQPGRPRFLRHSMCLADPLRSRDEQLLLIDAVSLDAEGERFEVSQLGKAGDQADFLTCTTFARHSRT